MRVDDATMLMLRVVDEHAPLPAADGQPRVAAREAAETQDESALGWLRAASKDLKSVSEQMAEQADQASERLIGGLRSLKDLALRKYRGTFKKDKNPPRK